LAFGKRDLVFISVADDGPQSDGTWISGTVSVITPKIPRQRGFTRAFQDSITFYKPLAGNQTKVTIVCRIDMNDSTAKEGTGGMIPMWLYVKTLGQTAVMSVSNMRKQLVLELKSGAWERRQKELEQEARKHRGVFGLPIKGDLDDSTENEARLLLRMDNDEKNNTKGTLNSLSNDSQPWWKRPRPKEREDERKQGGFWLPWAKQEQVSSHPPTSPSTPWWKR
jgi:hypothetical protein